MEAVQWKVAEIGLSSQVERPIPAGSTKWSVPEKLADDWILVVEQAHLGR